MRAVKNPRKETKRLDPVCATSCDFMLVVQFASLSLWERAGVRAQYGKARNNSPGFSPFSRGDTSQFFNAVDACEEFLNGLRAEARGNVVVEFAHRPSPQPSPKRRGSQTVPLPISRIVLVEAKSRPPAIQLLMRGLKAVDALGQTKYESILSPAVVSTLVVDDRRSALVLVRENNIHDPTRLRPSPEGNPPDRFGRIRARNARRFRTREYFCFPDGPRRTSAPTTPLDGKEIRASDRSCSRAFRASGWARFADRRAFHRRACDVATHRSQSFESRFSRRHCAPTSNARDRQTPPPTRLSRPIEAAQSDFVDSRLRLSS
ncbi:MAG: hypothetical protein QOI77_3558 [Blastocatellia bacterium]|nr:hypothetical protein [Blastocatellia bacterium]